MNYRFKTFKIRKGTQILSSYSRSIDESQVLKEEFLEFLKVGVFFRGFTSSKDATETRVGEVESALGHNDRLDLVGVVSRSSSDMQQKFLYVIHKIFIIFILF